jgi:isopentenyl-diphosphate Delta-isomerase
VAAHLTRQQSNNQTTNKFQLLNNLPHVILVNENDEPLGTMEKLDAHQKGILHRAFSIFIFNSKGEMLLQKRALKKYHSPGLWSNACCSHPYPDEEVKLAALRRLREEMGFTSPLEKAFDFLYKISFENGLTEHEFDHAFVGTFDGDIKANPEEVADYTYRSMAEIRQDLVDKPGRYTAWFRIAFPKVEEWLARGSQ